MMTARAHTIQEEIFAPHPCIEHFAHVGADFLETLAFSARQMCFAIFVVASVKFICYHVFDASEGFAQRFAQVNVLLKVAGIIMDQSIGLHLE